MQSDKVVTYSLLAHIQNTGTLTKDLLDVFVPLAKRALSLMNSDGFHQGKNISEIKDYVDRLYGLDIPIPVLRQVLQRIADEFNQNDKTFFKIYYDNSFSIANYLFADFDTEIEIQKSNITKIEKAFSDFCKINGITKEDYESIFDFIEKNKLSMARYLSDARSTKQQDFTTEARFVEFTKTVPTLYSLIRNIYLGSILSSFLEYKTTDLKTDIELLLDTNFIVSLIDLNTPESTHTCQKLISIAREQKFKLSVLQDTIDETQGLLSSRADHFDHVFLQKRINPEDIFNACARRNLSKTDLLRISDNLIDSLSKFEIHLVYDTTKYRNEARFSRELESLKKVRNTSAAALHDATAIFYVREKRGNKNIKDFENVNCWFVNNSTKIGADERRSKDVQAESIKADDLLSILWLSNPAINKIVPQEEIIDVGLTALISVTLNENLPKSSIIRELDGNITKYAGEQISDKDIIRIGTRIVNRQLKEIEELNQLAKTNADEFVKRLDQEAQKQKVEEEQQQKRLEEVLSKLDKSQKWYQEARSNYEEMSKGFSLKEDAQAALSMKNTKDLEELRISLEEQKAANLRHLNADRERRRTDYVRQQVLKWRTRAWVELAIILLIFLAAVLAVMFMNGWNLSSFSKAIEEFNGTFYGVTAGAIISGILSTVFIKTLTDKYRNHSNIKAFKESLVIPEDLKPLTKLPSA